jgi:ABC-2 type transport system ATP-binding protein
MDEADSLCDRVAILNQGKIIDMGTPEYLKSKIHGDIILELKVENPNNIDANLIKDFDSVEDVYIKGNLFIISLKSKNDIKSIINVFNNDILSVNTKEPTLEDVFIHTIK